MSLFCLGLQHRLQRNLCLVPEAPSPCPFSLTFISVGLFLSHISILLSSCLSATLFYIFLNMYSVCATKVIDCHSSHHQQVCPGGSWNWICLMWGKYLISSHRSHPWSPSASKNLAMEIQLCERVCMCVCIIVEPLEQIGLGEMQLKKPSFYIFWKATEWWIMTVVGDVTICLLPLKLTATNF